MSFWRRDKLDSKEYQNLSKKIDLFYVNLASVETDLEFLKHDLKKWKMKKIKPVQEEETSTGIVDGFDEMRKLNKQHPPHKDSW